MNLLATCKSKDGKNFIKMIIYKPWHLLILKPAVTEYYLEILQVTGFFSHSSQKLMWQRHFSLWTVGPLACSPWTGCLPFRASQGTCQLFCSVFDLSLTKPSSVLSKRITRAIKLTWTHQQYSVAWKRVILDIPSAFTTAPRHPLEAAGRNTKLPTATPSSWLFRNNLLNATQKPPNNLLSKINFFKSPGWRKHEQQSTALQSYRV